MTAPLAGETLVIASHNPGKLREIAELIEPVGVAVTSACFFPSFSCQISTV